MQPYFDNAFSAWYPNLSQKLKKRHQIMQNKCIRFWLQLDKMSSCSQNVQLTSHKKIKNLPVSTTFEQCVIRIVFKLINVSCPYYLNKVFKVAPVGNIKQY